MLSLSYLIPKTIGSNRRLVSNNCMMCVQLCVCACRSVVTKPFQDRQLEGWSGKRGVYYLFV